MKSFKFKHITWLIVLAVLFLGGCSQKPQKVRYGEEQCAHCKMVITDSRFAAEIVTSKGKAIKFDAIECMAAYLHDHPEINEKSAALWVSNFAEPGSWIDQNKAIFIQSEKVQSPMGKSLLALKSDEQVKEHLDQFPGRKITWEQIKSLAAKGW